MIFSRRVAIGSVFAEKNFTPFNHDSLKIYVLLLLKFAAETFVIVAAILVLWLNCTYCQLYFEIFSRFLSMKSHSKEKPIKHSLVRRQNLFRV